VSPVMQLMDQNDRLYAPRNARKRQSCLTCAAMPVEFESMKICISKLAISPFWNFASTSLC